MREGFAGFLERQRQRARRRLGISPGDHCAFPNCGESDPLHLTGTSNNLLCYEHLTIRQKRSPVEDHHPATRAIEPAFTVPMLGNDHRVVTVMSKHWLEIIKSTDSSATAKDLARMASILDSMRLMLEKYGPTIADLPMMCLWWDQVHPGWREEFERWVASRERREP